MTDSLDEEVSEVTWDEYDESQDDAESGVTIEPREIR
jgi:hypothetical protein